MKDLENIEFLAWTHRPKCNSWVEKFFDYYVLDYAESGRLLMKIGDTAVQRLKGPVAFLTFPGPYFRFGRHVGHWNHRFISFRGPLAEHFAQTGLFPIKTPVIPLNDSKRFKNAFDELLEYMEGLEYGTARAAHLLEGLLLQLHEQAASPAENTTDHRISGVIEKIIEKPENNWNLQSLASKCRLSYPHFRRLFMSATGQPPGNFIIEKRMEKAAKLLRRNSSITLHILLQ
jgi:AraC-like DNA-binding protein